ncbi:unnamed protein product [Plutella xylostella]|uniref:(diamondback moth) hypothetical protein n=1 Tax=Plutella xylostella TaxID=51655 RepID=A0A8S4EGR8_PLUXY|nr:RNA polymerase I-specific transcription initiation factor RRN3 [Plutella xylostella]CAG9114843.1 unnamed protein product [Plutella xylostella]
MAVAAQKSIASLMQKTLDRQANVARMKFRFKENQVQNILLTYITNNTGPYNDLIEILKTYPLSDENFKLLIEDCISCVVLLGRELKLFVSAVCAVEWTDKSPENIELYSRFLIDLVTAHAYHSPHVMDSLVKLFRADGENWENTAPEKTVKQWSNIHNIIAQIVAVMPMTSDILMQTIIKQFPYYKAGICANRTYIHNLIWITKYIPSLLEQIIMAIINRMVTMDVNLAERAKNKSQSDTVFSMDVDEEDVALSDTLDYCMLEVLRWLQDEKDPAWRTMCNVFERVILPTYGIRHVQFLLLYTISISQQCADRVLNNLWAVMAGGMHGLGPAALATRRTAASHLAGLLARCVRMPNTRLIHFLRSMAEWCHSYITATQEGTAKSDNTKVHGAFYAVCHAIFYLVAFKHQQLFMSKESINFVESLNLPRLVTCSLNPLRSCPSQVTRAFSSVTRSHQVVYCQAIIEKNARQTLQADAGEQFDNWFPYDPYTLPRSGKIIWPLCIEYKDWLKDGDDETQYSSRMRKLESEDDDYLMASPGAKLASSLSNCISPGFKSM